MLLDITPNGSYRWAGSLITCTQLDSTTSQYHSKKHCTKPSTYLQMPSTDPAGYAPRIYVCTFIWLAHTVYRRLLRAECYGPILFPAPGQNRTWLSALWQIPAAQFVFAKYVLGLSTLATQLLAKRLDDCDGRSLIVDDAPARTMSHRAKSRSFAPDFERAS